MEEAALVVEREEECEGCGEEEREGQEGTVSDSVRQRQSLQCALY